MKNRIQEIYERDRIYTLYHAGRIDEHEVRRRLRAIDNPAPRPPWPAVAFITFVLIAGALALR